ncbi:Hsp20/alpha crystallin family protein [Variovorax sp. J22P240]|uniref:Hsp20/alpha crystallin family protein n=1 Tax=Variovorax sp. J22P240 TaxID=3053514 RepID=UPI002576DCD4|nr:Hsp20/alpha crystallin family protein [Variovorax sp. J22P240]MDM0002737.1 Hsp20/alpha crystallin family protein [Variovorax sp. J22P240]
MYRSLFPRDMFAEMDRLQREMQQAFDLSPTIRGFGRSGFPALNVGGTAKTVEIYALAPGVDPGTLEVHLDRGILTIAGERKGAAPASDGKETLHINERFEGAFRRVLTLPDDADPESVEAKARDGVVHITVQRQASSLPRRIAIQ